MSNEALKFKMFQTDDQTKFNGENIQRQIGSKAASLYQLRDWGITVPDFCLVGTDAFRDVLQQNNLLSLLEWLTNPLTPLPMSFEQIQVRLA